MFISFYTYYYLTIRVFLKKKKKIETKCINESIFLKEKLEIKMKCNYKI